jgi:type II secretory pathway component PulK
MRRCHGQRGSVLVLTLWLAAGLAAAALVAGHVAVLRYRCEGNRYAARCAEHAIDGARCYVAQLLTTLGSAGELPDVADYTAADIRIGECRVWLLGRSADADAAEPVFALQDEGGRLNLNLGASSAQVGAAACRTMLEALPGMTPELAGAIIDWRDTDDDLSSEGAESETYLARDPPSSAKNSPFETVDELRLLNGAEAYLIDGLDRNRNTLLENWEKQLAAQQQERFRDIPDYGFADLLTVYSREPGATASATTRLNLKGDAQTLRRALTQLYGAQRAASLASAAGRAQSVLHFCILAGLKDDEAATAFERFTVSDPAQAIVGRVNINTASAAVLACLPGVGTDNAARLVAYREQNPAGLGTPFWLVSALGADAALAVASAGDLVTTKSYQVTADVVAVGPACRAFRRVRFVFDLTTGEPVVVSRRDVTHLGWPLGEALHRELAGTSARSIL